MHLCLPGSPKYKDTNPARHPQMAPISVEDNTITFSCPNCEQEFKVEQVVTDAFKQ